MDKMRMLERIRLDLIRCSKVEEIDGLKLR
jgi:hypothetical protein